MRYFFMLTILMIVLLTGIFYYVSFTPALIQQMAPSFIEKYFKEVTLDSLKIGGQSFTYPDILKLYNIQAEFEYKGETYQGEIAELDFLNFQTFVTNRQQALLQISGFNLTKPELEVRQAVAKVAVNLSGTAVSSCDVILQNGDIKYGAYQMRGVQAHIAASKDALKIADFKAQTYGGQTKGKLEAVFSPKASDTALFEFSGLKSQELAAVNKRIFSQMTGDFSGNVRVNRLDGSIQVFALFAEIPGGGTIAPALGKRFLSYMTNEGSRAKLADLLEKKDWLDFDNAQFQILNVNRSLAGVTFTINSKKEDLHIHDTINIDIDRVLKKMAWKK